MAKLVRLHEFAVAALSCFLLGNAVIAAERSPDPGGSEERIAEAALASGSLGLFPATDFRLVKGDCSDCATIKQALWYFQDDLVAVPKANVRAAGWTRGVAPQEDVRHWYGSASRDDLLARPPLVWVGSPSIVSRAYLQPGTAGLRLQHGAIVGFKVTPKISSNRSYYDTKTAEFFQRRLLRIRGHVERPPGAAPTFVARTIWPQDFTIDAATINSTPLASGETLSGLVRREAGPDRETYEVRLLWERNPGRPRNWDGFAALGVLLNGAQGDDDEAHGGHFAIVTGRYNKSEQWADWLVNNFYNLDYFSEKGIVAAMVPMDNYQMDLNSGQSYYRPSYLLVALLKNDEAAYAYQGAIQRVYNRFYRHDFLYHHAASNCAGISMDTLRSIGWNIPTRGPTGYLKAIAAYPYMMVKEMSLESGQKSFDYLREEQTRLYPAVAFDAIGNDLLRLVGALPGNGRNVTIFERILRRDLEAIIFVRIPQIPSSRAYGAFPVASMAEYLRRVPEDKSKWQIVPVDPRPFPKEFADAEALNNATVHLPVIAAAVVLLGSALFAMAIRRRTGKS